MPLTSFPFMDRYPFDALRAVSQVEPLTMNGILRSTGRIKRSPWGLPAFGGARGDQGIEGW